MALLDFRNVIRPNGLNPDSKTSHFEGVLTLKDVSSNVSQWEKLVWGPMASYDGHRNSSFTVWPLCQIGLIMTSSTVAMFVVVRNVSLFLVVRTHRGTWAVTVTTLETDIFIFVHEWSINTP